MSRAKVMAMKAQADSLRASGDYEAATKLRVQARQLEKDLLEDQILFYMDQYTQALGSGNKTDVVNIGRLLRKSQVKLEGVL